MTPRGAFAEEVLGKVDPTASFEPQVLYDPDGDCIEFLASDDPYYAERIDSLVTVYYSRETGEIIGSLVKGVKSFIRKMLQKIPGFKIEIEDGRIRLEHLFTAHLWYLEARPENWDTEVVTYKKLRDVAETVNATAELCLTD
jgi:hypothetical protein